MLAKLLLCLGLELLLCEWSSAQGGSHFVRYSQVNLSCPFSDANHGWKVGRTVNPTEPFISNSATLPIYTQEFGNTVYLIIKNFTEASVYRCLNGNLKTIFNLHVAQAPTGLETNFVYATGSSLNQNSDYVGGAYTENPQKQVSIECRIEGLVGEPYQDIARWVINLRNGTTYRVLNRNTLMLDLSRNSSGEYICYLANIAGPAVPFNRTIDFVVNYEPTAIISSPASGTRVPAGKNLEIVCQSTAGSPAPHNYHLFRSTPSSSSSKVRDSNTGRFTLATPARASASGNYTCKAENTIGTSQPSKPVEIVFVEPPSAVRNLANSNVAASTATLSWSPPTNNGGNPIQDFRYNCAYQGSSDKRFKTDLVLGTQMSATVTGLHGGKEYTCSVAANNGIAPLQTTGLPSTTFTTLKAAPCAAKLTRRSQDHQHVCVSSTIDCHGGHDLSNCTLVRTINGQQSTAMQWQGSQGPCRADGIAHEVCDRSIPIGTKSVQYTFVTNNVVGSSISSAVFVQRPTQSPPTSPVVTSRIGLLNPEAAGSNSGSSNDTAVIAGIVVGVVLAIAVAVGIIYFVVVKGKKPSW